MDGGTFTISNGGVFGSLFGTPIINPPQSAILGMHGIFDRPVAVNGKVRSSCVCPRIQKGEVVSVLTWGGDGPRNPVLQSVVLFRLSLKKADM